MFIICSGRPEFFIVDHLKSAYDMILAEPLGAIALNEGSAERLRSERERISDASGPRERVGLESLRLYLIRFANPNLMDPSLHSTVVGPLCKSLVDINGDQRSIFVCWLKEVPTFMFERMVGSLLQYMTIYVYQVLQ